MARYECDRCGACCKFPIIEIDELDLVREPKLIQVSTPFRVPAGTVYRDEDGNEVEEIVPGFGAGAMLACGPEQPCRLLGPDNRCTIYPSRPNCCVAFQAGSRLCQEAREAHGLPPLDPVSS